MADDLIERMQTSSIEENEQLFFLPEKPAQKYIAFRSMSLQLPSFVVS